jgi:hypothetical protein
MIRAADRPAVGPPVRATRDEPKHAILAVVAGRIESSYI